MGLRNKLEELGEMKGVNAKEKGLFNVERKYQSTAVFPEC